MGQYALQGCCELQDVTIPNSVTTFEGYCFQDCRGLQRIIVPSVLTSIGNGCFQRCRSLKYCDFSQCTQIPTLGSAAFTYDPSDLKIIVPDALYDDWIVATNWSTYASKIIKASEV